MGLASTGANKFPATLLGLQDPKQTTALQASRPSIIYTFTLATMSVHADPPPTLVREPNRVTYLTGSQLGKGGFAICHRAELCEDGKPSGKIVALKIVRSKMEPAKLAQKVPKFEDSSFAGRFLIRHSLLRSYSSIQSFIIRTLSNSIAPFLLKRTLMSSSSYAKMDLWQMLSGSENILPCLRSGGTSSKPAEQ